jgi:hypothetical protein
VRDERGDVDGVGEAIDHVEILGVRLPPPGDAGDEGGPRNVLHPLHQAAQPLLGLRADRGEPYAAVPTTTVVTPWRKDGASSGSHVIWPS